MGELVEFLEARYPKAEARELVSHDQSLLIGLDRAAGGRQLGPRGPCCQPGPTQRDPIVDLQKRLDELASRLAGTSEDVAEELSSDLDQLREEIEKLRDAGRPVHQRMPPACSANGQPSPRELDILQLLAAHWSRREIAEQLDLSVETVKTYLRDLYRKLGVHERADAVRLARKRGWL
jgi:DNA-binding NarL/FixJ family response regulator